MTTTVLILSAALVPLAWGYIACKVMVRMWPTARQQSSRVDSEMANEAQIDYQI